MRLPSARPIGAATVVFALTLLFGFPGAARPLPHALEPAAAEAVAMFERFKQLEGRWATSSGAGWSGTTTYQVIARGSVVMSTTTFRDAPDRTMVTMFHLDGDRLVLTHYCEARNQPHLTAEKIDIEAGRVEFRFHDATNLPDRDHGHMDSAIYDFAPDGTLGSRWTWYQDGAETWMERIEAVRVR